MKFLSTIQDVINAYPDRIHNLFKQLNLGLPEFKKIQSNYNSGMISDACSALLSYYESNYDFTWVNYDPQMLPVKDLQKERDDIENDTFTFQLVCSKIPRLANGYLDWENLGPNHDKEFAWALNRHHFLNILVFDYRKENSLKGKSKTASLFNKLIQDWLISNPCPNKNVRTPQWRALEAALRMMWIWPFCFFGFLQASEFTPASRLLMLSSIVDHAEYIKQNVVKRGNIKVMEYNSIATVGAMWPEFTNSKLWINTALDELSKELLSTQVYPDGIQKELTSHYHRVAMINFEHCMKMAEKGGISVSKKYKNMVERMWNYLAYTVRPDGFGLLNNDSDRDDNRERVLKAAKTYGREDWKYIITNESEGDPRPPQSVSFISPWAGQIVSRQSCKKDSLWSFFDFGPLGIGHIHRDKNHVSIFAHGRDFLVDGGRFRYIGDKWRKKYFQSTPSHNTILIDGKPQMYYPRQNKNPIPKSYYHISEDFDYAVGVHSTGYVRNPIKRLFNKASHIRAFNFIKEGFWVIIDRVKFPNLPLIKFKSEIQALWHFHPDCEVKEIKRDKQDKMDTQTNNILVGEIPNVGKLAIIPIFHKDDKIHMKLVKGQEVPEIQGWWSREYNHKEPNICAIYTQKTKSSTIFGWLIIPFTQNLPNFSINDLKIIKNAEKMEFKLQYEANSYNFSFLLQKKLIKDKVSCILTNLDTY